jgi:putative drug exporter of the RND superfamily
MAQRHPVAILPADAPSVTTAQSMKHAFHEPGSENVLIVLLKNDKGLGSADENVYRTLVDHLRNDRSDVVTVQDFLAVPMLRQMLGSHDNKAWLLPVGLAGELGTPESYRAYTRVSAMVRRTIEGSAVSADFTGPAATVADLTDAGDRDRSAIEMAIGVLLVVILLLIYRNPITMMLPLIAIGASLQTAQALVASVSLMTGMAVSNQTIVLLSALMSGAGTDYVVFLVSRYHDYIRQLPGSADDHVRAVQHALVSIGKVIGASAATVGVTLLGMGFAKLGLFSTVGPALAIGVAVAFLAAVTLLPAILVIAGPRGWIAPRRERTAVFWRRAGVRIVRHPKAYLAASMAILILLAGSASLVRFNYDDRKQLPASDASSMGYAALEQHFPVNQTIPEYLFIQSPQDLRTPQALADLEQMAQRVSQVRGIAMVRGVTRPTGESLEQARATYQAKLVGGQLGEASTLIDERTGDLNRLASGAGLLADSLGDVRTRITQSMGSVRSLVDALDYMQNQFGGNQTFAAMDNAARLVTGIRALGDSLQMDFAKIGTSSDWIQPVVTALDASPVCDADSVCAAARSEFHRLQAARDDGILDNVAALAGRLQSTQPMQSISSTASGLSNALQSATASLHSLGLDNMNSAQTSIATMQNGVNDLAGASRELADGVQLLVDQTKKLGEGLNTASSFLTAMGRDASQPSMAGFNVPPQVRDAEDFKKLLQAFISPDGHSVRYFIQTNLNPFSADAMDQVNMILRTAEGAQPNTALADAKISMSGYPVTLRDTRDYYDRDIRLIIVITIGVVFLILAVLLRAVVAPLYLVGSVLVSYLSAVGMGVLLFQFLLRQELHWSVPGLAFVVLVAVGADYNMLIASRLRDESPRGIRRGVIRTVSSTGGVITAAGLIFAAAMYGLLFASIGAVVQGGFVIGTGILIDTFVVRTVTVPAIATLFGQASWWPMRPGRSATRFRVLRRRPS